MPFTQHLNNAENYYTNDIEFCLNLESFLKQQNIKTYNLQKIQSDASKRQYYRVILNELTQILMDASQEMDSLPGFITIATLLNQHGIKAPIIQASDLKKGFLLLEDLGDISFTSLLQNHPEKELELYSNAIDVLNKIANIDLEIPLERQDKALLNKGLAVFLEFYVKPKLTPSELLKVSKEIYDIFHGLYYQLDSIRGILTLRDYHADNLMWVDNNEGIKKVGVLDFQDAVLGFPTYDLVSFLEDARRDVSPETVEICKDKYFSNFINIDITSLKEAYTILGVQRNLRIIGAFHRLNSLHNKPRYLAYLPRVWQYIREALHKPLLKDLRTLFNRYDLYEL